MHTYGIDGGMDKYTAERTNKTLGTHTYHTGPNKRSTLWRFSYTILIPKAKDTKQVVW